MVEDRSGAGQAPPVWHAVPVEAVFDRLATGPKGLTEAEATNRREEYGPNRLPMGKPRSLLSRLAAQFNNLLIHVLLAAAMVTMLLGHWLDASVILAVVLANAVVGLVQEGRAEQALDAIRNMLTPHAAVRRDDTRQTIDAADLVPGDVVLLEAGDKIPADLRLFRANGLRLEEAALTGESVPVDKSTGAVQAQAALGDRVGIAHSGTLVAAGQGEGIVVATGSATEIGRISAMLGGVVQLKTPLVQRMDEFARRLTYAILALSAAVFAFAWLLRGYAAEDAFLAVVGIAVAAIPEGLPAVLTITMAIGVQRMAARHAIVRRLAAVETLGAVSVICTDKTGTLTRNEMSVAAAVTAAGRFQASGEGYAPDGAVILDGETGPGAQAVLVALARAAVLCNDAVLRRDDTGWGVEGDPMEGALLAFAARAGQQADALRRHLPQLAMLPFDSRHRYMATLHAEAGQPGLVIVKGAPERILDLCDKARHGDGPADDHPIDRTAWEAKLVALAEQGQRVLGFATRAMPAGTATLAAHDVESGGLVLLGLVGLIDPPRAEAIAAVAECQQAGIRVKMITGDHAATAGAIALQVGLRHSHAVVTGQEIEALDEAALRGRVRDADVFARASPEHKLRLVEALQAEGAVVAMTGDGVNDAPALKRAEVGVAMGRNGTEAAKEAAEMVLADDNFATIAAAVREGRTVYDNIQKVIAWTLPTNGGEALIIILAILLGVTLPLTPVQILWINMVTAVALGLTLAFEPAEADVMRRPPRDPAEPLLSGFLLWRIILVSCLFAAGAFAVFEWSMMRGLPLETSRTAVVNAIVVMEIAYLFSVRYQRSTSLSLRGALGTQAVLIGVATVVVLQLAFTYAPPLQFLFASTALDPIADGLPILGSGVVLLMVLEIEKVLRRRLAR